MTVRGPVPAGLHMSSGRLPDEGELASFSGATGWLNPPSLTPEGACPHACVADNICLS
jgi:hypothetical protein